MFFPVGRNTPYRPTSGRYVTVLSEGGKQQVNTMNTHSEKNKFFRGMGVPTMGLLLATTAVVVITPQAYAGFGGDNTSSKSTGTAQKATFAQPGVGEWFHGGPGHPDRIYSGRWKKGSKKNLLCTNFSKHSGDGSLSSAVHRLPGFSLENSKAAFKLGNASEATLARVTGLHNAAKINSSVQWAVWKLSKDRNLHRGWKPAYVPQLKAHGEYGAVQNLIDWGHNHGPYTVVVKASGGATGHGTVIVTAANGKPASYLHVDLSSTLVKLSSRGGTTNSKGLFPFKYGASDLGSARIHVKVTAPSSTTGELYNASKGRQRLLTNGHSESASGGTKFQIAASTAKMKNECTTDCHGIAKVTWTAKAKKGSVPMRTRYYVNGKVVAHCDTRSAKKAAETCSVSKHEADASHWTGYDSCVLNKYQGGHCITSYHFTKVNEEIVCIPAPSAKMHVVIDVSCPCDGDATLSGDLTASVLSLKDSVRFFTGTLTDVTNGKSDTVDLTNGTPSPLSVRFVNGHEYRISFKAFNKKGGKLLKQGTIVDKTFTVS